MNIVIQEFEPSPQLMPFVQAYWRGDFNVNGEQGFSKSVLPNGCIELIIHSTSEHCHLQKKEESWIHSPDFTLLGMYDQPYEVKFSQKVTTFGIRFHPDGIRHLFGVPPSEFLATYEDGVEVLGKKIRDFCSKMIDLQQSDQQIQWANDFLSQQLKTHFNPHDYTHQAMKLIRKMQGMADYEQLTRQLPISNRQLQREFKATYGITVTDYMRLARLNAIQRYMQSSDLNFTQMTYDLDFSDQSHFIREFKKYTGLAPGKFVKKRSHFIINPS